MRRHTVPASLHKFISGIMLAGFLSVPVPVHAQMLTAPVASQKTSPPPVEKQAPALMTREAAPPAVASSVPVKSGEPVDLQADRLEHNDQTNIVTASGNVMLVQAGRILHADEITYDVNKDQAHAQGHVVLNEVNGDIHYAEEVELNDQFKNGFVEGLKTELADGSRFTAEEGKREGGVKTTMYDASYTPCEPCKADPEKAPVWQIRADEVEHDQAAQTIEYKNATFDVLGVPVLYTPYFSHPDGTILQKSGFLSPTAGFASSLGAFIGSRYYWAIAPDRDATMGVTIMTEAAPLVSGEYRRRWDNAQSQSEASITYSEREDREDGVGITQDEEVRGHIFSENLWDINNKWRSGLNVQWASDDQYLRQYDIDSDDVLENDLYAERFSGRNYTVGRILTFQDVRVRENQEDQPQILPEIITSFVGEPGSVPVIGGRWSIAGSALGLRRGGSGADVNRLSLDGGYQKRMVSDYGFLTNVNVNLRADSYYARDRAFAMMNPGADDSSTEARIFPQMHVQTGYPVAKEFETMQARIEPIVALTLAPNIDVNEKIPNEDSRDVQIDASNLFEPNRFPGFDRVEDQSRVTTGILTGLYNYNGSQADIFLGQSYRLNEDDNPFPEGSGLDERSSDVVGQVTARTQTYDLNYRFQLDSNNLSSQRHEVDAGATFDRFGISGQYLFAKALSGTDIDESREQIRAEMGYYLTPEWQVRTSATQDLGRTPGLRQAAVGLDYFGQCLFWSLTGQRNLTDDSSGESDTEILFRIGLKNLSDFERSRYLLRQEQREAEARATARAHFGAPFSATPAPAVYTAPAQTAFSTPRPMLLTRP
ncbi:MAG: LPS-assembly protein LptD [Alphaproteobacteria bacterium]